MNAQKVAAVLRTAKTTIEILAELAIDKKRKPERIREITFWLLYYDYKDQKAKGLSSS